MARYIDADKVINSLPDDLPYKASVKRVLMQAPEEDIAEANEKNIPKKLKVEVTSGRNVRSLYYFCPSCNSFRMRCRKHCSNCGQALDWKETFREYALDEAYENAEKLIEEAKAMEEKYGKWIKKGNEKKCSACDFIYYSNNDEWRYCPNCGARMAGGVSDG